MGASDVGRTSLICLSSDSSACFTFVYFLVPYAASLSA